SERKLFFSVKNTGATTIDIDVWAFWWNRSIENVRADWKVPAVGAAIVTNKGIEVLEVAGIRKDGSDVAVEPEDSWHLGAETKAMTATLVGVLAQKKVISPDLWLLKVPEAFPEWADTMNPKFKDATFARLMAHRSGIVDQTDEESAALEDATVTVTGRRREFARLILHRMKSPEDVVFDTPDVVFSYQNANFILAAAMLERCTDKSWEDLMMTEIFQPLGMSSAGFLAPGSPN